MSQPTLTVTSRNYDEWSLAGWLLCRMAGLDVSEKIIDVRLPTTSVGVRPPSALPAPILDHQGVQVWDPMAIGEYLHEVAEDAELLPKERRARAQCRSMCAEVHVGFRQLRAALPMSLNSRHGNFKVWDGATADIERIATLWHECLSTYGGPYLFGSAPTMADAMYAPMCTRVVTYNLALPDESSQYVAAVMALPEMMEWVQAAKDAPEDPEESDIEF
jgi:glutathione S-transferase